MSLRARFGGDVVDVTVKGGTLEVETLGEGPAVVLVHGWTLDRRVWEPQVAALAGRFRVTAFDRRGFGRSTAPPGAWREPDDLVAIADALGAARFGLVGMSQGARVALAAAIRAPGRVAALALQGAPLDGMQKGESADEAIPIDAMVALADAGKLDAMRALWRAHPLMQVAGEEAGALLDAIVADYAGRDLTVPGPPLAVTARELHRVRAPVLVVTGAREPVSRHKAAAVIAGGTRAQRVVIPDGGHLCNLDRASVYNPALARFLETAMAHA